MPPKSSLTYKQNNASKDILRYLKAIGLPIGVFLLALFCISRFAAFGTNLIAPLTGIMWAIGGICAFILPSQRASILNETHVTIGCYLIGLTLIRELIALASGISSEVLMATYNQAIPVTSGSAFAGYLQTMLWITAIMTPLGFILMEVKKVISLKRRGDKNKTIDQLRGIRSNGTGHME